MKKEWILTLISVVVTVIIALGLVRWLAPGLLGYAVDQQMVRLSREVPPFYSNIFREDDRTATEFLINDPVLVLRAKPLFPDYLGMGPHDILGFRNRNVPNNANIIAIGDSQTYGNNAALEENWPSQLEQAIFPEGHGRIYNMSVGAWGGVNFLQILEAAINFQPQVIIIAFYTGNDPYSDYFNAYSMEEYAYLRPEPALTIDDLPDINLPTSDDDLIGVIFEDGVKTVFTPDYRLSSNNRDVAAVHVGYGIMGRTASLMAARASSLGIHMIFTIIPTKELVYAPKVENEGLTVSESYQKLIRDETVNIANLAEHLRTIPGSEYVDLVLPMQEAALSNQTLYPEDSNGHPFAAGYGVIADTLQESANKAFTLPRKGIVGVMEGDSLVRIVLLTDQGVLNVPTMEVLNGNGWEMDKMPTMPVSALNALPYLGILDEVDPERFGPEAFLDESENQAF